MQSQKSWGEMWRATLADLERLGEAAGQVQDAVSFGKGARPLSSAGDFLALK